MKKLFETVDVVIIANTTVIDENFFYVTRLPGMWEHSFAVVFPDRVEIIAPPLEEGAAHTYTNRREMEKLLKRMVDAERIGFNGDRLPYNHFRYLKKLLGGKWIDVSRILSEQRAVKRKDELHLIKKACRISLQIVEQLYQMDERMSERELATEIEHEMRKNNACPSFDTIVAYGIHTASPHHTPTNKRWVLPALIDLGAKYRGYSSDITRSFVERRGKKLHEIVENALHMAVDEMKSGVAARSIYKLVEDYFGRYGYRMRHALGHSIGINVHDGFSITRNADFVLQENMVFAIEPAVYLKRYGIRIEEDVVVGKNTSTIIR